MLLEDLEIISVIRLLMPSWVLPICLSWHVIKKPLGCVQIIHCTYFFKYFLGFQFDRQLAVVRTDFFFFKKECVKELKLFFQPGSCHLYETVRHKQEYTLTYNLQAENSKIPMGLEC